MFPSLDFITIHILERQQQHLAVTWNSFVLASISVLSAWAFLHGSLICRCEKQLFVREAGVILTHYLRQMFPEELSVALSWDSSVGSMFHATLLSLTFETVNSHSISLLPLSQSRLARYVFMFKSSEGNRDVQNTYSHAEMSSVCCCCFFFHFLN